MNATGDFLENQNQNPATSSELESGLAVVQSHQAEELRRIVVEHMRRHPLAPLEEETILVQSTGTARWLQLALAVDADDENAPGLGISASTDFLLPARFFWGAYRIVLGDEALPEESPFDTDRLRWRILSLLPGLVEGTGYEPLAAYLAHDSANPRRRWQLACALADLYEQYQFYRADWLMSWEKGVDTVSDARGNSRDIDERQRWQPALWRAILESMPESRRQQSRAHLHHRFLAALESAEADGHDLTGLPRRLVVFGISSLPMQMIEGLAALAHHCQVLVCLHNPCRHYWADIIEGRDLLRSTPGKRLARRHDWPEQLDESRLHQLANPLLAAWGRQGRDFQDLLGEFDEPERYRDWFARIDVFDEHETAEDRSLLQRIQQGILDLRPDPSDPASRELVTSDDRSLRFHIAHSRQREVEILHDQLLAYMEEDATLQPRDIIVMVPDIDTYAPHIDAVFGSHVDDVRHIPYSIGDRRERTISPCLKAFETLLDLPRLRLTASEVIDLLAVPAVRGRFDIDEDEVEQISQWLGGAGIRWGLHGEHRKRMGIDSPFEQNSWYFGIRRMLLGHANGATDAFDEIQPFEEAAGGSADLIGRLAWFIERLEHHWQQLDVDDTIAGWGERLRALVDDFILPASSDDELALYQLDQAIEQVQEAVAESDPELSIPLDIVRDAMLERIDVGHVSHRFLAGKVNFSTLMPMRAIPFRMVCLLGMNDGDYPRTRKPADFDLMSRAGLFRPGDRSRREDDRYLFLEALLSARDRFYLSWVGKSIRNDDDQPTSVLVGQLRDHVAAGWRLDGASGTSDDSQPQDAGERLLHALTTRHPLQPFSASYFAGHDELFTYAHEWRQVHQTSSRGQQRPRLDPWPLDGSFEAATLGRFLKQPVRYFTEQRLGARLDAEAETLSEEEPFSIGALEKWQIDDELLGDLVRAADPAACHEVLERAGRRLRLSGRLPVGRIGQQAFHAAVESVHPIAENWARVMREWPGTCDYQPVRFEVADGGGEALVLELEQWLPELRQREDGHVAVVDATATRLLESNSSPRWEKLVNRWPLHLVANAAGWPTHTLVAHAGGVFEWHPMSPENASDALKRLIEHWQAGLRQPLPVACATAGKYLAAKRSGQDRDQARSRVVSAYDSGYTAGEVDREPALKRWYPDFQSFWEAGPDDDFDAWAERLYGPAIDHWRAGAGDTP